MNSGTIAGLTSAPLKTKGWNFIKNVATFTRNGVGTNVIPAISLANTTTTISGGAAQYSPVIEWAGSAFQSNLAGANPAGSYPLKFQAGVSPGNFTNSVQGGFFIRGQQTATPTTAWDTYLYFDTGGSYASFIRLTNSNYGFYGTYPGTVCYGTSPSASVFSIGSNGRTFLGANANLGWTSAASTTLDTLGDAVFSRSGAADIRQGYANAAAPISQTFSVQNVLATTSNTLGVARYIDGCQSTGTANGGSIVFRVSPSTTTGAVQNPLTAVLTIDPLVTTITNPAKIERAYVPTANSNTTITLVAADAGSIIRCTAATAITINLPATTMAVGYNVTVIQEGAGIITFASNGNTLNSYAGLVSTAGAFATASLVCTVANTYVLYGNLA